MTEVLLPIFPLHTVLFPGGPLHLRIFEARYLDMVSECLREDKGFGVCLIRSGDEVGKAAQPFEIGTIATIADWDRADDDILKLTAIGMSRFRILESDIRGNQLMEGKLQPLSDECPTELPSSFQSTADVLQRFIDDLGPIYTTIPQRFDDASWVSYRLSELLPIPLVRKQYFLELEDPVERLRQLDEILKSLIEAERER